MNNIVAFLLFVLIIALIITDQVLWQGEYLLFLGKKLLELITYFAFWR